MWTPDTTTQSRLMGGQALAAGISGGTKSLADSIGAAMEQRKQENVRAKASETLFKSTPELQDALGMDEEQFKGLSSAEKNELVKSGIGKISLMESLAKQKRDQEEQMMRMEAFRSSQAMGANRHADEMGFNRAVREQMQINPQSPELGNFYENPEQYPQGRPTLRLPGDKEITAAGAQYNQLGTPQFDNLLNSISRAQPKEAGLGPETLAKFGFVPTGGQVNPNGSASLTFGPPDPQYPGTAEPILTKDGQPTGKATFQGKTIDLSPPNSEGKTLTQSENQMLGALNQAGTDLDNLDKIFKKLGPDWGGPVSGRVKNATSMGQSPDITAVENAINAATPNLARGVFREVGVLTDEDIKRYKALLPTAYDTDAVRKVKMDQLRERIVQGKKETMDSLRKAGRDLSGFDKAAKTESAPKVPPGAAGKTHEQLIQEANAAIQGGADEKAVRQRLKELGVEIK